MKVFEDENPSAPGIDPASPINGHSNRLSNWSIVWGLWILSAMPMLVPYFMGLWQRDYYQFFPFVFLAVGLLIRSRWNGTVFAPRGWFGWSLVAIGLAFVALSLFLFSPWFSAVGFVLLGTAFLHSCQGADDSTLLQLSIPLFILVRLPAGYDELLINRLQVITTKFSSLLLDILAVPHTVTGNVIDLATRRLFVAEACSGIQSVFSLAFLACLILVIKRHLLWFTPFYLAAAIFVAVFGNILRVTSIAAASQWYQLDWTEGWRHEVVGYTVLLIAILFLLSFDQLVLAFLHPIWAYEQQRWPNPLIESWNLLVTGRRSLDTIGDGTPASASNAVSVVPPSGTEGGLHLGHAAGDTDPLARKYKKLLLSGAVALVVVSLTQTVRYWIDEAPNPSSKVQLFVPPKDVVEASLKGLSLVNHEVARDSGNPRLGKAADIWTVGSDRLKAQLVLSQPYFGWHELCICYENIDWVLKERSILEPLNKNADAAGFDATPYVLAKFSRNDATSGYLLFSAISYQGVVERPPLGASPATRIVQVLTQSERIIPDEMMMLQLWIESPRELASEELQLLKENFINVRSGMSSAIRESVPTMNQSVSNRDVNWLQHRPSQLPSCGGRCHA
jgi:exosortase